MSQQQSTNDISVDGIPIDISNTQSGEIELAEVPAEIESITLGLASEQPPTNQLVVLKAAHWWYLHGKSSSDPAFRWAIEWARHLATDTPSDVERFDEFLEYLVTVGSLTSNTNSSRNSKERCSNNANLEYLGGGVESHD